MRVFTMEEPVPVFVEKHDLFLKHLFWLPVLPHQSVTQTKLSFDLYFNQYKSQLTKVFWCNETVHSQERETSLIGSKDAELGGVTGSIHSQITQE